MENSSYPLFELSQEHFTSKMTECYQQLAKLTRPILHEMILKDGHWLLATPGKGQQCIVECGSIMKVISSIALLILEYNIGWSRKTTMIMFIPCDQAAQSIFFPS